MRQKIFLSFSGLIDLFRRGGVTEEDLNGSLFAFGCDREAVFSSRVYETMEEYRNLAREHSNPAAVGCIVIIQSAIEAGEAEGRVVWRTDSVGLTLPELNGFLVQHGYSPIHDGDVFTQVPNRIQEANPSLEAIRRFRK